MVSAYAGELICHKQNILVLNYTSLDLSKITSHSDEKRLVLYSPITKVDYEYDVFRTYRIK